MRYALLTLSALLAVAASAAQAQNIVGNPGFETGTFPPWTTTSGTSEFTFVDTSPGNAHSGNDSGLFLGSPGGVPSSGTINQTLTTVGGKTYLLDFWAKDNNSNLTGGTDSFTANWAGTLSPTLTINNDNAYHEFTLLETATGTSTVLSFNSPAMGGTVQPWTINLDDVSVSAINAQTPEPGNLALLVASSLSGAAFLRRRRRRQSRNGA